MIDPFSSIIEGGFGFGYGFPRTGTSAGQIIPVTGPGGARDAKPSLGPADAGYGNAASYAGAGLNWICGYGDRPPSTPQTYLSCLLDPVLAAARMYALSPIKTGKPRLLSRPDAPAGAADFIKNTTSALLPSYVEDAAWAVDMGFAAWQTVWAREDGNYIPARLISCQQEADSGVMVDQETGDKVGVRWNGIELTGHRAFVYTHDRRGQQWLGRSRLENVIETIHQWREANHMTAKMGRKAGGVVIMVGYPPGEGKDAAGNSVPRWKQAQEFGKTITGGSGYGSFPLLGGLTEDKIRAMSPADLIKFLELSLWQFRLLDLGDPGKSIEAMTAEKRYLDELKCLGYGVPPEAVLQGTGGNRAKSQSQGNSGTAMNEPVNRGIYCAFNEGVVNSTLVLRYGPEVKGSVWWEPEPLEDPQAVFDRTVLAAVIQGNGPWSQELYRRYDLGAIADRNGLPARAKELPEPATVAPPAKPDPEADPLLKIAASANGHGRFNGDGDLARGLTFLGRTVGGDE